MKKLLSYAIAIGCLFSLSCEDNNVNPDVGFIRANIDGVETVFKTPPPDEDYYNYIRPGAINIRFNKNDTSSTYWGISIIYGYAALDVKDLPLPFTIKGPSLDFTGKTPDALIVIVDPDATPYGAQLANASTFSHDFTLTITSVHNNVIKGTFHGIGFGEFTNSEFSAALPVKDW